MTDYTKELKIAVINCDLRKLEELCEVKFQSSDKNELLEASALTQEAIKLLEREKAKTLESMRNIQKMKSYLLTDEAQNLNRELF